MKKIFLFLTTLIILSSCATTNESRLSRIEVRKDRKASDQAAVKEAIESKNFIIKLDKVFATHGGIIQLVPRANYIIVNGDQAEINTAYLGRQYDFRGIVGINTRGKSMKYEITKDLEKGRYKISMVVSNGNGAKFDVYLDISKSGYCSASVSSLKIENIRYSGYIVPIKSYPNTELPSTVTI